MGHPKGRMYNIRLEGFHVLIPVLQTPIGMSIHQVMHDKKYFPDPETFRPQRWLEKREDGVQLERYYVPFGRGTRMCVGQQ